MTADRSNEGKAELSLVPNALVEGAARALMFGLTKYERDNWRRGFPISSLMDSLLRHAFALTDSDCSDIDAESGLHHADHLAANIAFVLHGIKHGWRAVPTQLEADLQVHLPDVPVVGEIAPPDNHVDEDWCMCDLCEIHGPRATFNYGSAPMPGSEEYTAKMFKKYGENWESILNQPIRPQPGNLSLVKPEETGDNE